MGRPASEVMLAVCRLNAADVLGPATSLVTESGRLRAMAVTACCSTARPRARRRGGPDRPRSARSRHRSAGGGRPRRIRPGGSGCRGGQRGRGQFVPGRRGAGTVLAVAGTSACEPGRPGPGWRCLRMQGARPSCHLARQRQAECGAPGRGSAGVPVVVAVAHPARPAGNRCHPGCRRGTPPQAWWPLGAATACG
jgi:hypothetical protein